MNGRIVGVFIVAVAAVAGAAMYYLQVHAFYERIPAADAPPVTLVAREGGQPETLAARGYEGIDAPSSPLRHRACLTLDAGPEALTATYEPYPAAEPLTAPRWFRCFDAVAIGAALETGAARAFLSVNEVADGVDRVMAVYPDGRAFVWHQLNDKYRD